MPYIFSISPDVNPSHITGWFIFNTWLQKTLGEPIHLELYSDFASQRKAIVENKIDLIYSNPYDAAMLVRKKAFTPIAYPENRPDEAVIAVRADNPAQTVEELSAGIRAASTNDPDVHMMCMIMLEPAELDRHNVTTERCKSYIIVAKSLLKGDADIGFFLDEAYNDLSNVVKKGLRPLISSNIYVFHHALMVGPRLAHKRDEILSALLSMGENEKGRGVLRDIAFSGWIEEDHEDMEFMIDVIDTLVDRNS
ncbi:MAG: phosphate/phosphite/phosphonate ABC transporter substrate-binding protein [Gammaproteobacteria bacterium]|nr:phosphate/phosphite/phosphonate ABC transporter substrate-binding protein [Gammaproteobacteria bacterium]